MQNMFTYHVSPETNTWIISDGWIAYSELEDLCFRNKVFVHRRIFKNSWWFGHWLCMCLSATWCMYNLRACVYGRMVRDFDFAAFINEDKNRFDDFYGIMICCSYLQYPLLSGLWKYCCTIWFTGIFLFHNNETIIRKKNHSRVSHPCFGEVLSLITCCLHYGPNQRPTFV